MSGSALPNRAFYQLNYTRIFSFCYYTTLGAKIKDFPVCGHSCGLGRFSARFADPAKSRKRPCFKAFRAFAFLVVDGVRTTPKAGALPTALHPVIQSVARRGLLWSRALPKDLPHYSRSLWEKQGKICDLPFTRGCFFATIPQKLCRSEETTMRMRKKPNLVPRMEACADWWIREPEAHRGSWRNLMPGCRQLRVEV